MATLTLHDVPEDLVARLEERAHAHGRSLTSEVLAALESLEPAAAGPAVAQPAPEPVNIEPTLQLHRWRELRSQFKRPPLTSEEIIAAIERDSHPPELDRFGNRINPES